GQPIFIYAAESGDIELIRKLIEKGADVSAANSRGWTPIFQACKCGHPEAVKALLAKGADAAESCHCGCGWTPLHGACQNGHVDIV
ncbi:ankyrin, partial [Setomelanomma holmii]